MKEISHKEQQQIAINILKEFKKICIENNLKYYLGYGTLLGAVRNKKIIEWDDDIDIIMPREDYMKLIEVFPKNNNYEIFSMYNKEGYYYLFAKIIDKKTKLVEKNFEEIEGLGVYIDIFPIDGLPKKHKLFEVKMFILKEMLKLSYIKKLKSSSKTISLLKLILCPIPKIIGYKPLLKKIDKEARKYRIKDSEEIAVTIDYVPIKKNMIKKEQLEGDKAIFENEEYAIPKNPELILNLLYGENYMTPLKSVEFQKDSVAYFIGKE